MVTSACLGVGVGVGMSGGGRGGGEGMGGGETVKMNSNNAYLRLFL